MKDVSEPDWKNCHECLLCLNCKCDNKYCGGCPSYKTELTLSEKRAWDRMEKEESLAYWDTWSKHFTWEYIRKFSFGVVAATAPFYTLPVIFCLAGKIALPYCVLWFLLIGTPISFVAAYWNYHAEYKTEHGILSHVPPIQLHTFFRKVLYMMFWGSWLPVSVLCWITSPYYIYRFIMSVIAIDSYWKLRANYDKGLKLGVEYSEEWF